MNKTTQQVLMESGGRIYQKVVFGEEAHKKLLEGASILAKAVGKTLGPSGHSVIIDTNQGAPFITKDGVTVARAINLKEKLPSMGAELIKEVASKTNEVAGDGTSTATVLAYSMLKEGVKMISSGRDSIYVKKGMDIATEKVIQKLKEFCIPVRNSQDIINIGTISANGDKNIGELLASAIDKVGQDGIITIEPGKSTKTTLEVVEGMQFDGGYLSPYFVTNSEKNTVELENPYILLTSRKISSLGEFIPILEKVAEANRPLLVIADEVEGEALHTLIVNKLNGVILSCAVKAPSYGENRTDILGDIACVTGGEVLDSSSSVALKNLKLDNLGLAKKVIISRTNTTIIGSSDEDLKKNIEERVLGLRTSLSSDSTLDALHVDRYRKRLAKLAGGVALIKVGGSTEVEILEKKDRVEDALNATIAATQEGIVAGGGSALFYASKMAWDELNADETLTRVKNDDEWAGIQVIMSACEAPIYTIVKNTGKSPEVIMDKLSKHKITTVETLEDGTKKLIEKFDNRYGYNAATGEYGDLINSGIIDPVKVSRSSVEYASSVIGLVLTCDSVICNENND